MKWKALGCGLRSGLRVFILVWLCHTLRQYLLSRRKCYGCSALLTVCAARMISVLHTYGWNFNLITQDSEHCPDSDDLLVPAWHVSLIFYVCSSGLKGTYMCPQALWIILPIAVYWAYKPMLNGSVLPWHVISWGRGWRRLSPDMEVSCKYMEWAAEDCRQQVALHLGGLVEGLKTLHRPKKCVTKCFAGPQTSTDSSERSGTSVVNPIVYFRVR